MKKVHPMLRRSRWFAPRALLATWIALSSACSSSGSTQPAGGGPVVPSDGTPLRNVDVTVIYPLPLAADLDALLKPSDAGSAGAFLTSAAFAGGEVPELDPQAPRAEERLSALRVVAVRVDPCPGAVVPAPAGHVCKPDVRLVFQSLAVVAGEVKALDGAIHAFYELPSTNFQALTNELRAWRKEENKRPEGAVEVPLGIHPRLASQGVRGAFATQLAGLLRAHVGERALVRITHFARIAPSMPPLWRFAIRERQGDTWQDSPIATTVGKPQQSLTTISGGRWDADIAPHTTHADDVVKVFKVSGDAETRTALSATVRVLNPRIHSSESIDCASCHVAPDIAIFADATRGLKLETFPDRFQTALSLAATAKDPNEAVAFDNIHMISYVGRSLSLASRTVNETAAVLEVLNARKP